MIVVQSTVNDVNDLEDLLWGQGLKSFKAIRNELSRNSRLEQYLEEVFGDEPVSITSVNDFFWFDEDTIRKDLGLHYEGEDEDEDEDLDEDEDEDEDLEEADKYNKRTHRRLHESNRRAPSHLRRFI